MADDSKDAKGRFLPGNNGGPGRPKGARNKLNEEFIAKLCDDFMRHGDDVIEKVRGDKPDIYLKIVASLAPKHVEVKDVTLDELERDELAALLDAVRSARSAGAADREGPVH